MIEWSEDMQLEGWVGVVGGLPILEVTPYDSTMFGYTVREHEDGNELDSPDKWGKEKERLAKHFSEWMEKAGLIRKASIFSCKQCRDSGSYKVRVKRTATGSAHGDFVFTTRKCDCLKNPLSIASIKQQAGR